MKKSNVIKVIAVIVIALLVSCQFSESKSGPLSGQNAFEEGLTTKTHESIKAMPGTPDGVLMMQAQALFGKLPATMPGSEKDTPARIALGKKLYFEEAISINKTQSCNTCHPIDNNGASADHRKTGLGALGKFGPRNDPPTLNAGYQFAQFWDGRSPTLKDQAKGPVLNPIEMGMPNGEAVAERLKGIPEYPADFKKAFPGEKDPVTFDNFAEAVAAFERTLISRGSFDRLMDGDKQAFTGREIEGMRTFINVGLMTDTYAQLGSGAKDEKMRFSGNGLNCTSCHQNNGTKQFGIPWMGVSQKYPRYRNYWEHLCV